MLLRFKFNRRIKGRLNVVTFMKIEPSVEKFGSYVASQGYAHKLATSEHPKFLNPAISISHKAGTGAGEIAGQLAQSLQQTRLAGNPPWMTLDHQLIEKALEKHGSPRELAAKILEDRRLFVDELIADVLGLQPPSWVLMPHVVETITQLANAGFVIFVGYGATLVTAALPNVFHVRLTGSLNNRLERMQKLQNLTPKAAAKIIRTEDRGRQRFIRSHFHARLDNELLYDLIINTDRVSDADAVALIMEGADRFFAAL